MRWLAGFLLLITLGLLGSYIFVKGYPYRLYSSWAKGENWNNYYIIRGYRKDLLIPKPIDPVEDYKEDFVQLWRPFPIRNTLIPLPVRHPLFKTIPLIQRYSSKTPPMIGMSIHSAKGRELSHIYTIAARYLPDYTLGQELFKLPFVRNRILKFDSQQVWRDLYSKNIEVKSKSMDEMIYDLYIIHLRSEMIPENAEKFGLIDNDVAVIEIASTDKDYKIEMINKLLNGQIYTYVLKTDLKKNESKKLRSKFLSSINFSHVDSAMGDILYREFKNLSYQRKIDQEGMLYLFAAWSLDIEKSELMREMIFYLERGTQNQLQLIPLHHFAFAHYGSTFTTKNTETGFADPALELQKLIELDRREQRARAAKSVVVPDAMEGLTREEKMQIFLQKAKESKPSQSEDITVH